MHSYLSSDVIERFAKNVRVRYTELKKIVAHPVPQMEDIVPRESDRPHVNHVDVALEKSKFDRHAQAHRTRSNDHGFDCLARGNLRMSKVVNEREDVSACVRACVRVCV